MAESLHPQLIKKNDGSDSQPCALTVSRVNFIISTYPNMQPFLRWLWYFLREYMKLAATPTDTGKPNANNCSTHHNNNNYNNALK